MSVHQGWCTGVPIRGILERMKRSSPRSRREQPESREGRKLRTRQRLVDAAFSLLDEGGGFQSLSLRRVAKRARIVPNAFYRHFADMDELGLALLDEGGRALRQLLRQVREAGLPDEEILRRSVEVYVIYVREHPSAFGFVSHERNGGSPRIRDAIRREMRYFASEMAADLTALDVLPNMSPSSRLMVSQLVVDIMVDAAAEILDLPGTRSDLENELVDRFVRRLVIVFLGARAWKEPA